MPITEGGKFSPVDRIVSPGVFTRENDLSGVAQGVAEIGAVILAPFPKGPGFAPTLITNTADLEEKFGVADGVYYGPYTAKEYLKEKGFVTVCRVGALTGYRQINPFVIWAQPGTWARSGSAGALNSGSSYVLYDSDNISSTFTYYSGSITALNSFSGVSFSSAKATLAEINTLTGSIAFSPAQTASLVNAVTNNNVVKVVTNNLSSLNVYPYTLDTTLSVIRNIYRLPTTVGSLSASMTINATTSASTDLSPITNSYSISSGEITFFAFSNVAFIAPYATVSTLTVTGSQTSQTLSFVSGAAFTGKFNSGVGDDTTLDVNSSSGSLYNSGQTYSFTIASQSFASVYVTSSYQGSVSYTNNQKLLQAIAESTSTTSNFSASLANSVTITNSDGNLVGTNITLVSGSIFTLRSSTGCGTQVYLKGVISGSFGKITGTFEPQWSAPADPCNPTVVNYYPRVLAVLSNTQYGTLNSSFEAPGFSGSVLNQKTATSGNYSGSQNPTSLSDFQLTLSQNGSLIGYYDFSLNPADSNYITNVFGNDPTVGNQNDQVSGAKIEAAYLYNTFEDSIQKVNDELNSGNPGWKIFAGIPSSGSFSTGETLKFTDQYSTNLNAGDSQYGLTSAATPWILSQGIAPWSGTSNTGGSTTKYQLFKVHTVSDGTITNKQYKIEISNVKLSSTVAGSDWGSFTLAVRSYSDTDKKPKYLEIFQNLSLDPNSSNFVARRIGDRYNFITYAGKIIEFGTYTNLSKYVRIEMNTVPYPVSAVPYGNEAYVTPLGGTIGNYIPVVQYSKASIYGLAPGKYASGTVISDIPLGADSELTSLYPTSSTNAGVKYDTEEYFAPLPFGATIGHNIAFDLESTSSNVGTGSLITGSLYGSIPSTYDAANEATYVKMRKFVVGFQGGFDGQSPAIPINVGSDIIAGNTQGLNCTNINSAGSIAYKQCVGALGNADEFDINLIVTPGVFHEQHSYVTQLVTDMCEARGDTFYIMDNVVFPSSNQTVGLIDAAVNDVSTIDSSYVATYYPWVKILDTNLNKIISVPPSVVMPSVYAANDNAAAEWFAPAGLNRGGIAQAVQVLDRTTHSERDTLYEGRVNPIAAFPGQGICVWGQKTLQIQPSALDRVNVRRLLIALKKFIASSSKFLVFEQNVAATRNRFLSIVNPYLESVQQRSGLYAFQVVMDDTNNTPDLVDRNILYGQIYLQPAKTAEFIVLDFNILPTGATFPGA
jgi:hypothetical protein